MPKPGNTHRLLSRHDASMGLDGLTLEDYTLIEPIHTARRSDVFRGKHKTTGQAVVVRIHRGTVTPSDRARYQLEFDIIQALEGEGIVRALDLLEVNGSPALVMEQFLGEHIAPRLFRQPYQLGAFLTTAANLARIVGHVHQAGVIHGDIKPTNVLIAPQTRALCLIDFGNACLLETDNEELDADGVLRGSIPYIAPEQTGYLERGFGTRSDHYSLGATYYELLCGHPPFVSCSTNELIHQHLSRQPAPPGELRPGLPTMVARIVLKLLAKDPEERYQSAYTLAHDLETCSENLSDEGKIARFELEQEEPRESV